VIYYLKKVQVAPGIVDNRPQSGSLPLRENVVWGHTEYMAQVWYDNLTFSGNTSINPFFYGTYLAETKPEEPVARTKKQAFQADAVGVVHQLTSAHFEEPHTFRVEWQPGKGGRIDWFVKSHKVNDTFSYEGDGEGQDWVHVYGLQDQSLSELMGSQIPNEPSYLIMNLAISSTWGFPYDSPSWCDKCYDCDDPKCTCAFNAGFCNMMKTGDVAMYIDSVRVYQSNNSDAHVGNNHTVGCDPPEYPTKEWIKGHEYRYMRNEPFVYEDKHPLRNTQRGGAKCYNDTDCGGYASENITALYLGIATERRLEEETGDGPLRGTCVKRDAVSSLISTDKDLKMICQCNEGYTGPRCTSLDHFDDTVGAFELKNRGGMPFSRVEFFQMPPFMLFALCILVPFMIWAMVDQVISKHRMAQILQPQPYYSEGSSRQITGRSV